MSHIEIQAQDPTRYLQAAERELTAAFGGPVRLGETVNLRDMYRNFVLRCPLVAAPSGAPPSVILKAAVGEGEDRFDPDHDRPNSTSARFYNEWSGTLFLNRRQAEPPINARLIAADRATGLLMLEDLGAGDCLADRAQGSDPALAEAAFLAYAGEIGRLHALTAGRQEEWRRIRREVSGADSPQEREGSAWRQEDVPNFLKLCGLLSLSLPAGFEVDLDAVQQTLDAVGPFEAFSPDDTCPDNHRLMPDGTLRFFDFEWGRFRHALLDAAYFYLPFPTCWCVNRLPEGLPQRMEAAYRAQLARGCPMANDEAQFQQELSCACAYWLIRTLAWNTEHALKEDNSSGISTVRQRHLMRPAAFADRCEPLGHLPALTALARSIAVALHDRWPDTEPMPVYPPFRAPMQP